MNYKIAFSAGEISGDEHLSDILKSLKEKFPNAEFRGLAGPKTRSLGFPTELEIEKVAGVMGFSSVLQAAPKIISALTWFKKLFQTWKPNLLVIVDYPDFNLKLAKLAKQNNCKVFYYIPPKLWAWRENRIKKIKNYVDKIALIFPFEKEFYKKLGYSEAYYVGHPFQSTLKPYSPIDIESRKEFFEKNSLDPNKPSLAFFPGSRKSEITRFWETMRAGLVLLKEELPEVQIILSVAPSVRDLIKQKLTESPLSCRCIEGSNLEILKYSDIGLIKSGTSNLQAAFFETPFLMYYKASLLSEMIVRCFVKIREFSIVNIIRSGTITELLQGEANPERIYNQLFELFKNETKREEVKRGLKEVRSLLSSHEDLEIFKGSNSAPQRAALLAATLLENK